MLDLDYGVKLVTRAEWDARPPEGTTSLWVDLVTSHWEGPGMGVFPHSSCAAKVRGIQAYHMDHQGWTDIAYNGLACPHRYVFEGRGAGRRSAANGTTAGNSGAYAMCYLGGQGDAFTEDGKAAMKAGGNWLTHPGSARNCHRDWKATACPGDDICAWTKAGQPIDATPPPPPPPDPAIFGDDVFDTFCSTDPSRPWVATSNSGAVIMFGETPARVAAFLQAGDQWAPNPEWHAGAAAGVLEAPLWAGQPIPTTALSPVQYDQALALIRRARH